nr:DUF3455 domain-containing protein [Cupriavidus pauculus]
MAACAGPIRRTRLVCHIPDSAPPDLQPADVRGTVAVLHADGTQNYQCKRASDGRLLWTLVGPDATLKDDLGQVVVNTMQGQPGKRRMATR